MKEYKTSEKLRQYAKDYYQKNKDRRQKYGRDYYDKKIREEEPKDEEVNVEYDHSKKTPDDLLMKIAKEKIIKNAPKFRRYIKELIDEHRKKQNN